MKNVKPPKFIKHTTTKEGVIEALYELTDQYGQTSFHVWEIVEFPTDTAKQIVERIHQDKKSPTIFKPASICFHTSSNKRTTQD
jgi:hypothetical protein